jgi:hypothetical protein
MIIVIVIIIILLGVVTWFIYNNFFKSTSTNSSTPLINPIPNFYLRIGSSPWINDIINDNNSIDNLIEWDGQMENILNPTENDSNKLAVQFRFFAEYWLNKLGINKGFTDVKDSVGILGKYEFSRNNNIYTAIFNNSTWNWNTTNYCFNTINAKRDNSCLGGWIYNNGKCYPPAQSSSSCNNYDWNTMYNYIKKSQIDSWREKCNIVDTPDCKYP